MGSKTINIHELTLQYQGSQFHELIQHHRDTMDERTRATAIQEHVDRLPEKLKPLAETFLDRWIPKVLEPDFFEQDTAFVFNAVIEDARVFTSDYDPSDDDLFHIFNILVMSYAINAGIHRTDFGASSLDDLESLYRKNPKRKL